MAGAGGGGEEGGIRCTHNLGSFLLIIRFTAPNFRVFLAFGMAADTHTPTRSFPDFSEFFSGTFTSVRAFSSLFGPCRDLLGSAHHPFLWGLQYMRTSPSGVVGMIQVNLNLHLDSLDSVVERAAEDAAHDRAGGVHPPPGRERGATKS